MKKLPFVLSPVAAGFPSPAEDVIDRSLDLQELLVKSPASTFFVRVQGESMIGAGINHDDILVVDRARDVDGDQIVVAALDGDFTVKHLVRKNKKVFLVPDNSRYKPLEVTETMDFQVWGVVTSVIRILMS
jgi:DNA polymerase V